MDKSRFFVRNVPYVKIDINGKGFLDVDQSITLTALRGLMVNNEISDDDHFEKYAHIDFYLINTF